MTTNDSTTAPLHLLAKLLDGVAPVETRGSLATAVAEVRDDSRAVGPGDLFVALAGQHVDGHDFIAAAAERGAAAVVYGREAPGLDRFAVAIRVDDVARALATIAANRWGRPAERLRLVGITGTNGKTTTSYLVEAMLLAAGSSVGVLGTVSYRFTVAKSPEATREWPAPWTTPSPLVLHQRLAELVALGADTVVMEVSSHALALERLWDVAFDVGAFSNLTQDHLDFHGTMERYFAAKARLFSERLRHDGAAVAMVDGAYGVAMLGEAAAGRRRIAVALSQERTRAVPAADGAIWAERYELAAGAGIRTTVATGRGELVVHSPLVGELNLANLLLAVGIGEALGLPREAIVAGLERSTGAPGRLEPVANGHGITVLVDYAHTPDALARVLTAVRPLCHGKLFVVFGCGGDRDRTKRPEMGRIAAEQADVSVITSDNPRTESPRAIIDGVLAGVPPELRASAAPSADAATVHRDTKGARQVVVEPDRRRAIEWAVRGALRGDLVLIAGKGHEDYQIVGTTRLPFDDRQVARWALDNAKTTPAAPTAASRASEDPS